MNGSSIVSPSARGFAAGETQTRSGVRGGTPRVPLPAKLAYTAFMAVLIPVYWTKYGPTNFLYFCDVALLLTLAGIWLENRLLVSMAAVGILLPQMLWCADFAVQLCGGKLTGMTGYMFDAKRPLFLRGLSLFHGWLPFLLLWLVRKLGYEKRALPAWTGLGWALCLICFFLMPGASPANAAASAPCNINYVFGFDDAAPQAWMAPGLYLCVWMAVLAVVAYLPTHAFLKRWGKRA